MNVETIRAVYADKFNTYFIQSTEIRQQLKHTAMANDIDNIVVL